MLERGIEEGFWKRLERLKGLYSHREIGAILNEQKLYPLLTFSSRREGSPDIYLQSGIHGDERASVEALIQFLEDGGPWRERFGFQATPVANPAGFSRNVHENSSGLNINRTFNGAEVVSEEAEAITKFILDLERVASFGGGPLFKAAFDLHEDVVSYPEPGFSVEDNPDAFYVYERKPRRGQSLATEVLEEMKKRGVPIWRGKEVYGVTCSRGVVFEGFSLERGARHSFDDFMAERAEFVFTVETPTSWALEERVGAHRLFLDLILERLRGEK